MREPAEVEMQALLYACGDMSAGEVRAFEALLSADQPAREALAVAVASLPPLFDNARPHPGYRALVRTRLAGRCRWRERTLWALGGAAAASLAFLLAHATGWLPAWQPAPPVVVLTPMPAEPAFAAETQQAVHFAELTTVDRLARVHFEEASRKRRNEEWRQRHPVVEPARATMPPMRSPGMSQSMM